MSTPFISRTRDRELIRSIMTNRWVYRHITDDGSPSAQEFGPPMDERIVYLAASNDSGDVLGIFMLHPHNSVCYEVHTCMTPAAWGPFAKDAGAAGCAWMFENTDCQRIITNVPAYNKIAAKFAIDCGMTQFGINDRSILKSGVLHDQVVYGLSKGDWLCQQQCL